MANRLISVIAGILSGATSVWLIENWLSPMLFSRAESQFEQDPALVGAYIEALPMSAKLVVVFAMFFGGLVAVLVAGLLGKDNRPALISGGVMLLLTCGNLLSIPHPMWMNMAIPVISIMGMFLGWLILRRIGFIKNSA